MYFLLNPTWGGDKALECFGEFHSTLQYIIIHRIFANHLAIDIPFMKNLENIGLETSSLLGPIRLGPMSLFPFLETFICLTKKYKNMIKYIQPFPNSAWSGVKTLFCFISIHIKLCKINIEKVPKAFSYIYTCLCICVIFFT